MFLVGLPRRAVQMCLSGRLPSDALGRAFRPGCV